PTQDRPVRQNHRTRVPVSGVSLLFQSGNGLVYDAAPPRGAGLHIYDCHELNVMRTESKPSLSGPKGQFIVGCLYEYRRDPRGFTARCARDYGDFVPIPFLNQTAYLLSDPLLIEEVLVAQHRRF